MLDNNIKNQLKSHFESLTQPVELLIALDDSKKSAEVEPLFKANKNSIWLFTIHDRSRRSKSSRHRFMD